VSEVPAAGRFDSGCPSNVHSGKTSASAANHHDPRPICCGSGSGYTHLFYNSETVAGRSGFLAFLPRGSMPETRELRTVVDAAEQAAAAGDYASAEYLLREAALLQEARLGPLHPDLANTLNNLGVVCEITNKPADAELCYRRAYAIATAVLELDHPFVATSRKNLRDFREARGKPGVELPIPPPVVAAERRPRATNSDGPMRERPLRAISRLFVFVRSSRSVAIAALGVCGLVFVMFIATRPWFGSNRQAGVSLGSAIQSPVSPASTPEPLPVEPTPKPSETATSIGSPVGGEGTRARAASTASPPTVADAQLCRDLSTSGSRGLPGDWQCDRPRVPIDPGSLFFYTRIRSAGDTTVQHRWYRGDQLRKVVELRIRSSPTEGYRTYSRNTVDHQSGGDWRVEIRTKDGILLHEERFVVR
jgi:hypothetical protein